MYIDMEQMEKHRTPPMEIMATRRRKYNEKSASQLNVETGHTKEIKLD